MARSSLAVSGPLEPETKMIGKPLSGDHLERARASPSWRRSRRSADSSAARRPASHFVIVGSPSHHQLGVTTSISGLVSAAFAFGVLAWAPRAAALTGGRLVYGAPNGCATQAEFEASVAERGGQFDREGAPGASRQLRVAIERVRDGFSGSFQALEAGGGSAVRQVQGATCEEVVSALAVVTAIELRGEDEAASRDAQPEPRRAPPVARETSPPPAGNPPPAHQPDPAPRDEGHFRASSPGGPKKIEVAAGTLRIDLARSITLFAGGELGLLPSTVLPRYDLSFSGASFVTTPEGKNYLVGVIPRVRLSYIGQGTYHASDVSVSGQAVSAALGLCWSPMYDTRALVALLCSEYAIGAMQLKSRDALGNLIRTQSPAFQTVGLGVEAEYNLGSLLHVGLKLGVDVPIQPLSAERPNGSRIFQSSTFPSYGMLGAGLHF